MDPRGAPINCTAGAVPVKNEKGLSTHVCPTQWEFRLKVNYLFNEKWHILGFHRRVNDEEGKSQQICGW